MDSSRGLAIVTGASSGIGAATARRLSDAGYSLLLLARRQAELENLGLPKSVCRSVDVRDEAAVAQAIEEATDQYGEPEVLINNAGIMPLAQVVDQTSQEWKDLFDTNCVALLQCSQLVLPGMMARGRGAIVNIGSIAGHSLYNNHTAYCGTKYAVGAITEGLRREAGSAGVRVILVSPGLVATDLLVTTKSSQIRESYDAYAESIGGKLDPSYVASAILYALDQPDEVCIREIIMAPTKQLG
jgi:NADP-dependent 3-hydroxy acid dehydrogenase YdfG